MTDTDPTQREEDANQRFAERLAAAYRPAPFGPAQRARFDANLRERIERRRPAIRWVPALAAAASLLLVWWVWPTAAPLPQPSVDSVVVASVATSWEADVISVDADAKVEEEDYLPDEYMAIAFVFIDET